MEMRYLELFFGGLCAGLWQPSAGTASKGSASNGADNRNKVIQLRTRFPVNQSLEKNVPPQAMMARAISSSLASPQSRSTKAKTAEDLPPLVADPGDAVVDTTAPRPDPQDPVMAAAPAPEPVVEPMVEVEPDADPNAPPKPKKKGWWSLGR